MRTLDALRRDLHHALWQLLANRGFASAAAVSLALGIGANTAIFCLVNEVLLRSLPVTDPGELVLFRAIEGGDGRMARAGENNGFVDPGSGRTSTTSFSLLTFERLRGQRSALSDVFAFAPLSQPNVVVDGEPEVSSRLIATMLFGVSPADPARYGGVAVMLTAVALMASLVPGGAPVASTGCRHCGRMTVVIRASLAIAALVAGVIALPSFGEAIRPAGSVAPQNDSGRTPLADRVRRLTRDSRWQLVRSVPIKFRTYHAQGMVKIGETLFVSSVEVKTPTKRRSSPDGRYDRDPGEGAGHLFKINLAGNLLADLTLGEGTMYHPGGIDYDGADIWVPVAEYRPDSRSIVYRVDPKTMKATEVFRFADHLGAIVHDTDDRSLHAVSWGSRRFYRWPLAGDGRVTGAEPRRSLNTSHYLDYQDCKYAGSRQMLCTGVTEMRREREAAPLRLGGIDLVSLADGRPLHQVPLQLWTARGLDMTHNAVWIEPTASGLRGYFMPEDDESTLYIYDVGTGDP